MNHMTKDVWSKAAKAYHEMPKDAPNYQCAQYMVAVLNTASSLSHATAILDIGCGTGVCIGELIELFGSHIPSSARLCAADSSAGMIDVLKSNRETQVSRGNELWKRLEPMVEDAHDLGVFADGSFSHMMGCMVYFMLPDPLKALQEAFRVLNTGGVFIASSVASAQWIDLYQSITTVRPDKKVPTLEHSFCSEEQMKKNLEMVGFHDVQASTIPISIPFSDHDSAINKLLEFNFITPIISDLSGPEMEKCREAMLTELKKMHPTKGPFRLQGTSVVGLGRK